MSLRSVIAQMKIRHRRGQVVLEPLNLPADLMKPKHVLVCLPSGLRELTIVKQFLPTIAEVFHPADVTLLSMPGIKVKDIFPRKGFQILSPSVEQLTWTGLPKKSYLSTLQEYKFDTVLDLNLEPSAFTSWVLLNSPDTIRIGRGNFLGKPFYNVEIKTKYLRDERNIYRSLLETVETLKNGSPGTTASRK
jgi:hypothetical protein